MEWEEASFDHVYEGVCSTLRLEQYMQNISEGSKSYWKMLDVLPQSLFYGTDNG